MQPSDNLQCPKPEETKNNDNNTLTHPRPQRCHSREPLSQFRSRFATSLPPIPLDVQRHFASALRTSGSVWERPSRLTPDLLSRLRPWQPAGTVRKPHSPSTPSKETRVVSPSPHSLELLERSKIESGQQRKEPRPIKRESIPPSATFLRINSEIEKQIQELRESRQSQLNKGLTKTTLPSPPIKRESTTPRLFFNNQIQTQVLASQREQLEKTKRELLETISTRNSIRKELEKLSLDTEKRDKLYVAMEVEADTYQTLKEPPTAPRAHRLKQIVPTIPPEAPPSYRSLTPPCFQFQNHQQMSERERHWRPGMPGDEARREQWRRNDRHHNYRTKRAEQRKLDRRTRKENNQLWGDTSLPWEDLAKEDTERIEIWRNEVAKNWSTMEKSVGFTEFGHLGNTYTQVAPCGGTTEWIPENKLRKQCPFDASPLSYSSFDNALTPVAKVERYKNWIRQLCNRGGYCYLILFKRKYRPYAFLLYGKNPQLGDLNLSTEEYLSEVFDELNIAVNYDRKLIHVYRSKTVTYEEGFEKYRNNRELIGNYWLPNYAVGATRTETRSEKARRLQMEEEELEFEPEIATGSSNTQQQGGSSDVPVVPEQRVSSLYASRDTGSSASQTARPTGYARAGQQTGSASMIRPLETDRTFMNKLMGGGMSGLQARRTDRRIGGEDGDLRDQRDFYKKKVEDLEKEKKE